jgi:mannosyltransferase OCH1-like enzyme
MLSDTPKILHCCWLSGDPLTPQAQKCLASWKHFLPDYEIKLWTKENYDTNKNYFTREMMKRRLWASISDYVRKDVVYTYGGIYLDLDVEIIKDPHSLYENGPFICFEQDGNVNDGSGFGASPHNPLLKEIIDEYERLEEKDLFDGKKEIYTGPKLETHIFVRHGLKTDNSFQMISGFRVLPYDYLCPMDFERKLTITGNTVSIHHRAESWARPENGWLHYQYVRYFQKHPGRSSKGIARYLWIRHPIKMLKHRLGKKID